MSCFCHIILPFLFLIFLFLFVCLQVCDWLYPLMATDSPVLLCNTGVFMFPDMMAPVPGSYVGVVLSSELPLAQRELFRDLLSQMTDLRVQVSDTSAAAAPSAGPRQGSPTSANASGVSSDFTAPALPLPPKQVRYPSGKNTPKKNLRRIFTYGASSAINTTPP